MHVEQIYTNCLAEASYYIESNGEAAIIDPIREPEPYLKKAKERNAKIKFVFETHFHADFVSGHIDLASKAGAPIVYGPMAETNYKVHNAVDGEEFKIGALTLIVLHTPGHTLESTCYLLKDENGKDFCVFTGDTLFVGDVGRPDLLDGKMTKEALASMMYDSLNNKLKKLADDVIVYPAHGPGSSCGKNIGKETWSTIGEQKLSNYALKDQTREEFIENVTSGLLPPPRYFFEDARINKEGYSKLDEVLNNNIQALDVETFEKYMNDGALVIDTRIPDDFEKGFIKGALNFGLNGQYAIWVATLIPISQKLLIVCDEGKEHESISRLARVGYENVIGYIKGGFNTWKAAGKNTDHIDSVTPQQFSSLVEKETVLDVRKPSEMSSGMVKDAIGISLADLKDELSKLSHGQPYLVHCAGGYRSMIAASMLKANGFTNVKNVYGGFAKIKDSGVEVVIPQEAISE